MMPAYDVNVTLSRCKVKVIITRSLWDPMIFNTQTEFNTIIFRDLADWGMREVQLGVQVFITPYFSSVSLSMIVAGTTKLACVLEKTD